MRRGRGGGVGGGAQGATSMETWLSQTRLPPADKQKVRRPPDCLVTEGPAAATARLLRCGSEGQRYQHPVVMSDVEHKSLLRGLARPVALGSLVLEISISL